MTPEEHVSKAASIWADHASKRARRYMDAFVRLKCAPDLLAHGWYPNAKEISESMAALEAARQALGVRRFGDEETTLIAPGDGCSPRTAGLFAYMTRWDCFAVDPRMRGQGRHPTVKRLTLVPRRAEDFGLNPRKRVVVAAVHSHANLAAAVAPFMGAERLDVIAIPCCVDQTLARPPDKRWIDFGILSPEREVMVWLDYKGERR